MRPSWRLGGGRLEGGRRLFGLRLNVFQLSGAKRKVSHVSCKCDEMNIRSDGFIQDEMHIRFNSLPVFLVAESGERV